MDPIIAGIISGGVGAAGSLISSGMSRDMSRDQMNFQREMANTAHQREVKDLRAAGLNPMLSALGNGSPSPQGAQGTVGDLGGPLSKGADTALAIRAQNKQLAQQDAQIENTQAQTKNANLQNGLIANQTASSALEVRQKEFQNKILEKTLPSMVKKAIAEGDYAEVNQLMGIISQGAGSAAGVIQSVNPLLRKLVPTLKGKP